MRRIAEDVWVWQRPFKLLGVAIGRRMTAIRLQNGDLLLHSPFPLSPDECRELDDLGPVKFLFDATCFHDTFARESRAAWPTARYLAPPGFEKVSSVKTEPANRRVPDEWIGSLELRPVAGLRKINETVMFHRPSGSLLVGDLVFNIGEEADFWTCAFMRLNGACGKLAPTRVFRSMIRNRDAFRQSIREIANWNFDMLIPCHGRIVESGAREAFREAFEV